MNSYKIHNHFFQIRDSFKKEANKRKIKNRSAIAIEHT